MKSIEELKQLAIDYGFSYAEALDPKTLVFRSEVRDMCAADKCRQYNRSWACPPGCGDIEMFTAKALEYNSGLIVQTVGKREDEFDFEAITETGQKHEENFNKLTEKLYELYPNMHPMGVGTCTRCAECTYPDAPCRFPHLVHPSMEACGLVVSEVCSANNMKYYYGPTSITFTSCYLLE